VRLRVHQQRRRVGGSVSPPRCIIPFILPRVSTLLIARDAPAPRELLHRGVVPFYHPYSPACADLLRVGSHAPLLAHPHAHTHTPCLCARASLTIFVNYSRASLSILVNLFTRSSPPQPLSSSYASSSWHLPPPLSGVPLRHKYAEVCTYKAVH